jgi:hypothetical protein
MTLPYSFTYVRHPRRQPPEKTLMKRGGVGVGGCFIHGR